MSNYLPAGFIIGVVFLFEILILTRQSRAASLHGQEVPYIYHWDYAEKASNIEVLGRVLYTDYYYLFIIASFILLVAMIGAIVLTHDGSVEIKRQDIFLQTSRELWS